MDGCISRAKLNGQRRRAGRAISSATSIRRSERPPSLLTHGEVVTLFHEFGHTLHHLLTEVDYPSLAGINGVAWDAVELPSQFMENFAWRPEVLADARAPLSRRASRCREDKIDTLNRSRTFLAGLAMLRQLEFALFDFRLHDEYDADGRARACTSCSTRCAARSRSIRPPSLQPFPEHVRARVRRRLRGGLLQLQVGRGARGRRVRGVRGVGRVRSAHGRALSPRDSGDRRQPQCARRVHRLSRPHRRSSTRCCASPASPRTVSTRSEGRDLERQQLESAPATRARVAASASSPTSSGCRRRSSRTRPSRSTRVPDARLLLRSSAARRPTTASRSSRREPPRLRSHRDRRLRGSQKRVLAATFGPLRFWNLYVPNGQSVESEKYALQARLARRRCACLLAAELRSIRGCSSVGDFNIAPEDRDVYDPSPGRDACSAARPSARRSPRFASLGLSDVFRLFEQPPRTFSWWDYRAGHVPPQSGPADRPDAGVRTPDAKPARLPHRPGAAPPGSGRRTMCRSSQNSRGER